MSVRLQLHRKYDKTLYKIWEIKGVPLMLGTIRHATHCMQFISAPEVNRRSEQCSPLLTDKKVEDLKS